MGKEKLWPYTQKRLERSCELSRQMTKAWKEGAYKKYQKALQRWLELSPSNLKLKAEKRRQK